MSHISGSLCAADLPCFSQKLLLVATGTYATIMGSPQLYCDVAAQESFVPIRMRGFNAEQANDFKCPT